MPDALTALRSSRSARALVSLGLEADVAFAAQQDRYPGAPRLVERREEAQYPLLLIATAESDR
jgi:phosphosulfolactate phosphohydrolase-like enzyme